MRLAKHTDRSDKFAGKTINLEFVSANPTGPIHLGGTRWAAVGDALARVLEAEGANVVREYYFNDHGTQIDRFVQLACLPLLKRRGDPRGRLRWRVHCRHQGSDSRPAPRRARG